MSAAARVTWTGQLTTANRMDRPESSATTLVAEVMVAADPENDETTWYPSFR